MPTSQAARIALVSPEARLKEWVENALVGLESATEALRRLRSALASEPPSTVESRGKGSPAHLRVRGLKKPSVRELVIEYLHRHEKRTAREIADGINRPAHQVCNVLNKHVDLFFRSSGRESGRVRWSLK